MLTQSAYLFIAKVLGYGLRILLPIFLVRIFTKAEFGSYAQFFLVEALLKTIFTLGVNPSLYFFVPRDPDNAGGYFLNSLTLSCVFFLTGSLILVGFREQVADLTGMQVLRDFFPLLVGYAILTMWNGTVETYFVVRKLFVQAAVFDLARQVIATIITLAAAWHWRDLHAVIVALILARLVSLLAGLAYLHFRHHGFRSRRYFVDVRAQVRYGVVLGMIGLSTALLMRIHEVAVNRFYDLETYAIYAAGLRQIPVLQFFGQSLAAVALVQFAQMEKDGDWAGIRALWDKVLASMYGIGIPLTVAMLLLAKPLVVLMFTRDYVDAVPIFRWNTIAMLHLLLNSTLILRAMDRNDVTLKIQAASVLILPPLLYGGMHFFGLSGIIAVFAMVVILGRIINHAALNRLAGTYLPYVASRQAVWAFYRDSWRAGVHKLRRLAAYRT